MTNKQQPQDKIQKKEQEIEEIPEELLESSNTQQQKEQRGPYICPICGRDFDSEMGLDMHCRRIHHKTLKDVLGVPSDVGGEGPRKDKGKLTTPPPEEITREAPPEEEVYIPTERDALFSFLKSLRFRRIEAVLKLCDVSGYTIRSIYSALRKVGASIPIINATISYWSAFTGEPVPRDIAKHLNPHMEEFRRPIYEDEIEELERRGYKVTKRGDKSEVAELLVGISELIKTFQQNQPMPPPNNNDEILRQMFQRIEKLEEANKELKEKLEQKEREILQKELEYLKQEIRELKNQNRVMSEIEFKDRRWQDFSSKIDRVLDWIEMLGTRYRSPPEYGEEEGASELPVEIEEEFEKLGLVEEE